MARVDRVAMNADNPRWEMQKPLKAPIKRPTAMQTNHPAGPDQCWLMTSPAAQIPAKATTEPTDKSIPAVMITSVAPQAAIAMIELC